MDLADEDVKPAVIDKITVEAGFVETDVRLKSAYIDGARQYARKTILRSLVYQKRSIVVAEQDDEDKCVELKKSAAEDGELGSGITDDGDELVVVSVFRKSYPAKPAKALEGICSEHDGSFPTVVILPNVPELPKYTAWAPVLQNMFVEDMDIDPYVPYFGDGDDDLKMASEVHDEMVKDVQDETLYLDASDAEVDENGILRGVKETWRYSGREQLLRRAAERYTILTITRKYGTMRHVWAAIGRALRIREIRRLEYIRDLAEKRETAAREKATGKEHARKYSLQIQAALSAPEEESISSMLGQPSAAAGALKQFCFLCQTFSCALHSEENIFPMLPIPDHAAEKRIRDLEKNCSKITPCSNACFLIQERWRQAPIDREEELAWTPEQLCLLREGLAIFRRDPCNLAVVIGSRRCREVQAKLLHPAEQERIERIIALSNMSQFPRDSSTQHSTQQEDNSEEVAISQKRRGHSTKGKNRSALKSVNKSTPAQVVREEERKFIPCCHVGPCLTSRNCSCAINDFACQSLCGCNAGRYISGLRGMRWEAPTEAELRAGVAVLCKRRSGGCECKKGYCNSEACACYRLRQTCNPDLCEHCDSSLLPDKVGVGERRCRNSDMITTRHKKTFVGRSAVQGFGLFAAEQFLPGDLVGAYTGRMMEAKLLDKSQRVSNAKNETFAFDVVESYTIDGGTLGSKVKFINHASDRTLNCEARCERVRGEARIALKASKVVKPGDEFLFDYKLKEAHGKNWAWINSDCAVTTGEGSGEEEDAEKGDDESFTSAMYS